MSRQRADLGFSSALDDLGNFGPEPAPRPKPSPGEAKQAAEAAGFRSRDPQPPSEPAKPLRRRRTGRNAQFNLKARPETIEAFCSVADAHGWGLGETLEKAVELLLDRYGK
ncbi:hypothetical protein LV780_21890 (plasmid) [Cereibacter azotoformans]|uniref:Stability/partitioning determinant n=1 Tax=Cereibacter azotoformans TaxID=43057 RepID=A0A2T5JKB5_9RHOB|nr:stability/partitioning determinant [Cereibacter azotoformans]AXQ96302.1 stability/partitioning determinant [Cereibacter sphaeroides]MBO4170797.1 hypothetical protein [Cereibacter azotoformans]PTR06934.1 hypothetical protein C8J28_1464 [Cereibacter azotoformans]UIJ33301.1 hypothetical protein LV780_21890 [Cereibacter azotoformans]